MVEVGTIYSAVYSGIPVFEMLVNGIAVMRRRTDSYMNATQILKVANIEKGKRTKILEKEVLIGEHEKVQGGYGKYQGTWIPFDKSKELATRYKVLDQLAPIFKVDIDNTTIQEGEDALLTKEQAMVARKKLAENKQQQLQPRTDNSMEESESNQRKKPKTIPSTVQMEITSNERHRHILMSIFLSDKPEDIIPHLSSPDTLNSVLDEQGNTALHWAAALARQQTQTFLIDKGAHPSCTNYAGETPLMRAVMVTNTFDARLFPTTLQYLKESISILDHKRRSVLHHAVLTAGIQGRMNAAIDYLYELVQYIQKHDMKLLNVQDSLGDTALTIAARLECQPLVDILIEAGAEQYTQNQHGLQAMDYRNEDVEMEEVQSKRIFSNSSSYSKKPYTPSQRGKEIVATVQKIVEALDEEYGVQLTSKEQELQKVQEELDRVTKELESTRKGLEKRQGQSQQLSEAQQKIRTIEESLEIGWQKLKERSNQDLPKLEEILQSDPEPIQLPGKFELLKNNTEDETRKRLEEYIKEMQAKVKAYKSNNQEIEQEIQLLDEKYVEKEMQCKKLIAACCNLPMDKIDDLVEPLILAIESDPPDLDLARVIGFMDKIRRQGAFNESTQSQTDNITSSF